MVTWAADGTMAGYDPVTKRLKKGLYHFASPGTVDLQAITRLNTPMGAGLNLTTFPNGLQMTAPLTFSAGDFTANPGKKLGLGMMLVRAGYFPEGHTPTPAEMFASTYFDWAQRDPTYAFGPGPVSHTFEINPDTQAMGGFYWNTKFWVLLYPSIITNPATNWSKTNDKPLGNINTNGRVLSFWSDRTPGKPTITSPVSGAQPLAGTEFTLRLNPADLDEVPPEDAAKYNDDVNGVHFQYRPAPTADNTNPEWQDLPFDIQEGGFKYRAGAWHIRGSRYWKGLAGYPEHEALIANLGCSVVAGATESSADYQPGKAALPTGDWQIRGRTFDYGHPYPNSGTNVNEPGPLGINPANNWLLEPAKDTYPSQNTSPWSDPVTVLIPAQVPPPLALSPKDAAAVSGNPVRLSWQYRNTHLPPRTQYMRTVQIRKVGDLVWSAIYSGVSSNAYVDLPRTLTQVPLPPMQVNADGDSEAGLVPWFDQDPAGHPGSTLTNTNNPAQAHAGNRFIKATNPPASPRFGNFTDDFSLEQSYIADVPVEYTDFSVDGWFWVDATDGVLVAMSAGWRDEDGLPAGLADGDDFYDTPYFMFFVSKRFTGPAQWRRFSELIPDSDFTDYPFTDSDGTLYGADPARLTFKRPPTGVDVGFSVSASLEHFPTDLPDLLTEFRLDDFTVTGTGPVLDDFELEEGFQYEWRVSAVDTDGVESGYSTPARFWVVPSAGSGEVIPVPSETIDGATLGCGTHRALIYRRGGTKHVGEVTGLTHVDWERVRDEISTAKIVVSDWDIDCGNLLAQLQTWAYELVLFRDNGYSVDRVWEGPITLLTYENDAVTIDAKDVMGYAYRRIIKQQMTDSGTGHGTTVVNRAMRVIQNVFAPDDPNVLAYLQVLAQDDDAMQYRSTPAYSRTGYEEIDDMAANSGLDYTAIGRSILLWGTKHRIGTLPEMTDRDLGASPIVSEYGMSFADLYSVSDGNGVHGEATRGLDPVSGNNEDYGLVEMLSSTWASDSEEDSGTYTQAGLETVTQSFKDFAERSIASRFPPPVVVRIPDGTSLNPDAVLSIQHLVPGVAFPLRSTSTLRTVVGTQKLDKVSVVEEKGVETVSITCSPFSRDDVAITEGGDE